MSRYAGPKNRLSRREGFDLYSRGAKLRRATQFPGQHGPKGSKRVVGYGVQLREKQKTKRIYAIMEKQFRKYFEKARATKGSTGERLLQLLETRLDNVVFRLGMSPTRNMARQMVSHGHIQVNGKKVTSPSYQAKVGDKITVSESFAKNPEFQQAVKNEEIQAPVWLKREAQAASGEVLAIPKREHIDLAVSEQLIVEFYSR